MAMDVVAIAMALNARKGGSTLEDLSSDTVTPETLIAGVTAHNASGQAITGTFDPSIYAQKTDIEELTVSLNSLENDAITDIALNGTALTKTNGAVNIPLASNTQAGAMSAAQAAKLDSAVTNAVSDYAFVMASGWTNNGSYVRRTGKLVMIRFNFINTAALTKAVVTPVQFDSTVISKIAPLVDVDNVIGIYSGTNTIGTCRVRITAGGAVTFLPSVEVPANGYFQGSLVYIANSD